MRHWCYDLRHNGHLHSEGEGATFNTSQWAGDSILRRDGRTRRRTSYAGANRKAMRVPPLSVENRNRRQFSGVAFTELGEGRDSAEIVGVEG